MDNKKILRYGAIAAIILIAMFSMTLLTSDSRGFQKVDTSIALQQLDSKNVKEARIDDREQRVRLELKEPIKVEEREGVTKVISDYPARTAPMIFDKVAQSEAEKYNTKVTRETFLGSMVQLLLPMLLFFALIMFVMTRMQGGGMGMFGFGGSRAKELNKDMPTNTFADVAGADEAVDELQEIKDFLQDPSRYEALGAKIPRGVLLYGPPGTGKTLLARAVAGEAGVPFYSISGSDFVEMFVGVGASRVRDLFKQAKENSPCIIFVDEIDAVGRQRGAGMGGGHDEREQTLNQLLVEMDGFGDRQGVILMAATNRPDILDPALLRPGRFDRQIPVTNPDFKGREAILKVHSKGKPFAKDVDITALAKRTAGMSGADLANVLNEAALLTARVGGNVITADALEEATDRVIGGPRRSSKVITEHEKKVTAYHEGGHTLAAWGMKNIESIYKVTILARGKTGGFAMTAQEDDKGMYTRDELFARIVFAMGGRSAEELVFGAPTTGASNDIEQATRIARAMITEYGMSPEIGTVKYGQEQGDPFSGRGGGGVFDPSDSVQSTIDQQTRYLVDKAHQVAYDILRENRHYLDKLAEKLLEKETLRRPDLEVIFDGLEPRNALEVFPGESANFPQQIGFEPVKTPVELAIERGEEPPKPFSILEASRAARAKRQQELQAQQQQAQQQAQQQLAQQPQQGPVPVAPIPAGETGRHAAPGGGAPTYGGTPPPADWSAPGWPPRDASNNPYAQPDQPREQPNGQHPGLQNYGAAAPANPVTPMHPQPSESVTEEFGFRLPDNEQPDHPEKPAEEPSEESAAKPAEKPAEEPSEESAEKPSEGSAVKLEKKDGELKDD